MKSYTVNPREEWQCLHIQFRGKMCVEDVKDALDHAGHVLGTRKWRRLLLDFTESASELSTSDLYDLSSQSAQMLRPDALVALVATPDRTSDTSFVENVARNRGLRLTAFVDAGEARAWLEKPLKSP